MDNKKPVAALVGNPNTGKSTIFNSLTGMKQHTGNWSGKTVGNAWGENKNLIIVDLPGIYSLNPLSEDEKNAVGFIKSNSADIYVIILDATCLERNLLLAAEVISSTEKAIVCLNLVDEAKRKNIYVDVNMLSAELGVPVIPSCGISGEGLEKLCEQSKAIISGTVKTIKKESYDIEKIYNRAVKCQNDPFSMTDRKIDGIVLSKTFGIPIMVFVLTAIFWLTIIGANYPSEILQTCFSKMSSFLYSKLSCCPTWLKDLMIKGVFDTVGCVVSVMLPPMAVFFPLFTLLEDLGYLPRMAFNLDHIMHKAKAHGKMVLTMCMGFGCNAAGVTSARIIDSPRERLIAILTNCFVPCNGRFPTLILLIGMFIANGSFKTAIVLSGVILISLAVTMITSRWLSNTVLKGEPSSTILELPPYRRPQIGKIIVRSIFDRTIFILGRAVAVAAPAGAVIWMLSETKYGGESLIYYITRFLEPLGKIMGMDGCILTGFLLGMPANEIVIPMILLCYCGSSLTETASAAHIKDIFLLHGWNIKTAVCVILFSLCHFPCTTTLMTIKKETKSLKWTAFAFFLPTIIGFIICTAINLIF